MNRRPHLGMVVAGFAFVTLGSVVLLDALGVWSLSDVALTVVGPALLILAGLAVLLGGFVSRPGADNRTHQGGSP